MTTEKKYNRFQAALDVQNASNPCGVALELVKITQDATNDPTVRGTQAVCEDPAVALCVDKLSDMTGRIPGMMKIKPGTGELQFTTKNYSNAYDACVALSKNRNHGIASLRWYSTEVETV